MNHGYKQAALRLHGLNERDRSWLLSQLPEEQRQKLVPLLRELKTLGIPGNLQWENTNAVNKEGNVPSAQKAYEKAESILVKADPRQLWPILESEPDSVIAALIVAGQWPWRHALEKLYRKARSRTLPKAKALTPTLRKSLIEAVASRLVVSGVESKRSSGISKSMRKLLWRR